MKKVIILIGNYCSGKTEIAMNMAMRSSEQGQRTLVIDLDRINDYFRMSDHIKMLSDRHVEVVSPTFVGQAITQTVMPAAVASAFDQDWDLVVFDVGGDQAGALSLARYHQDFAALLRGTVSDMMDGSSEEAVSALADQWAVARSITYLGPVQAAFTFNTQAVVAGSITSRMLLKSRDSQVKAFSKRYLKGPE